MRLNNCISVKNFEDTRTIYSKSDPAEIFMGSYTNDVIDRLFDATLERFKQAIVTSNKRGSEFTHESVALMYYYFQKIDIRRAESYLKSPDWIANKGATINQKNERDNKSFQCSKTSVLNYNKIKKKYFQHIEKLKWVDADFSSYQRGWKEFEQNSTLVALNVLFVSHDSEEIKLAYYKSKYNYKRKNQVTLLMINDEAKNCYYFALKNLSELCFLGWLRGRKEAIINGDNNFQNTLDDALNDQNIERDPPRISKIKSYFIKYNWEGIELLAGLKDLQKIEQNNTTIAFNVLFVPHNTETIRVAYRSEYNSKREKQVNLLMITDGTKWHYLAITNLTALLAKKSSDHVGGFYCLNCFNSYTLKNKLKEHEEICNNHDSCRIQMPRWVEKILKYNPGKKSLKAPFAIYLDLGCLLKKEEEEFRQNNSKKSYTQKKAKHEPSGWAMLTRFSFDQKENKLDYYRGKDCIKKLCKKLKERAMKIINYEKKEMIQLTVKENRSYDEQEACHICKEKFCMGENNENYKNRRKVKNHCHNKENLEEPPTTFTI